MGEEVEKGGEKEFQRDMYLSYCVQMQLSKVLQCNSNCCSVL